MTKQRQQRLIASWIVSHRYHFLCSPGDVSGGCICTEQEAKNMNLDGPASSLKLFPSCYPHSSSLLPLSRVYSRSLLLLKQSKIHQQPSNDHFCGRTIVCSLVRKVRPRSASLLTRISGIIFQKTRTQWLPNFLDYPKSRP